MIRASSPKEHLERLGTAVKMENVTVEFNGKPTLLNIDLEIESGTLTAVIGPNNAGKTTLLKTIIGLNKPAAGNVYIFSRHTDALKNDIGYVPGRKSVNWLFPINLFDLALTGSYNRLKRTNIPEKKDKAAAMEALERLGLEKIYKKNICDLTRGEKHRALIARAMVQDPRIYVMDEPMLACDEESVNIIIDVLQELKKKQKTLIVAHHDIVTIPRYFDNAVLINISLIASGKTDDIFTKRNFEAAYGAGSDIAAGIEIIG